MCYCKYGNFILKAWESVLSCPKLIEYIVAPARDNE
jgi:hypothetical protein